VELAEFPSGEEAERLARWTEALMSEPAPAAPR
jgi:hypothetical protein